MTWPSRLCVRGSAQTNETLKYMNRSIICQPVRTALLVISLASAPPYGLSLAMAEESQSTDLSFPSPLMAPAIYTTLGWLECEECIAGELTAVVNLGEEAIPLLALALSDGPSSTSRQIYTEELTSSYTRMTNNSGIPTVSGHSLVLNDYIDRHITNYVRLYRIRALKALSIMAGQNAILALQQAYQQPLPMDIKVRIREALASRGAFH